MSQHVLSTYILESVTRQWRKLAPPILSKSHCKSYGACSCVHVQKTIPLAPIDSFTKQTASYSTFSVSRIIGLMFTMITFLHAPYKLLPSIKNILSACHLFSLHHTLFVDLREFFELFFHAFTCLPNNSLISHQHFSHVCSTCHTIFCLKKTLECINERLLHCRLIVAIAWTPQMICIRFQIHT